MFIIQSRMYYLLVAILAKSHDICNSSYTITKKILKIIKTNKHVWVYLVYAIFRQFPPFISIGLKNVISYQLNFYIRTDGLRFTQY